MNSRSSYLRISAIGLSVTAVGVALIVGCKSTLEVRMDRYQGELLLSEPARLQRLESLVLSTQAALDSYVKEAVEILNPALRPSGSSSTPLTGSRHRDALALAATITIPQSWRDPFRPSPSDAVRQQFLFYCIQSDLSGSLEVRSEKPDELTIESLSEAFPTQGQLDPKQSVAPQAANDVLPRTFRNASQSRPWLKWSNDEQRGSPNKTGETPEVMTRMDVYSASLRFAEQMQALARTLETADGGLRNLLRDRMALRILDLAGPSPSWMLKALVRYRELEDSADIDPALRGGEKEVRAVFEANREKMRIAFKSSLGAFERNTAGSNTDNEVKLLEDRALDLLFRMWLTLEESYPRIAGIANFGAPAVSKTPLCPDIADDPRCELRKAQLNVIKRLNTNLTSLLGSTSAAEGEENAPKGRASGSGDNGIDAKAKPDETTPAKLGSSAEGQKEEKVDAGMNEVVGGSSGSGDSSKGKDAQAKAGETSSADLKGKVKDYFDAIEYTLVRLNELENPYVPVPSAGAYLALEEFRQAIEAQQRPGLDLGSTWQPITKVEVQAGANANYVVMRDHVGNWQVKAARNDPTELINAGYSTALAVLDVATQTGSATSYLREAYQDFAKKQQAGLGTPLAMDGFVDLLQKRYDDALAVLEPALEQAREDFQTRKDDLKTKEDDLKGKLKDDPQAAKQETKDAQVARDQTKAQLEDARKALRARLEDQLELQDSLVSDLVIVQQALEGATAPTNGEKKEDEKSP